MSSSLSVVMYLPSLCRLVHVAASLVLKCGPGATPRMLRPYDNHDYDTLVWQGDRCFADELLRALPRSVNTIRVRNRECCFDREMTRLLKIVAPMCDELPASPLFNEPPPVPAPPPQAVPSPVTPSDNEAGVGELQQQQHHHEHTLLGELLDHLLNVSIVLGVVLLLLLHRKLVGVIKSWKATLTAPWSPPAQSGPPSEPSTVPAAQTPESPSGPLLPPQQQQQEEEEEEGRRRRRHERHLRHCQDSSHSHYRGGRQPVADEEEEAAESPMWPASPARTRSPPVHLAGRRRSFRLDGADARRPLIEPSPSAAAASAQEEEGSEEEEESEEEESEDEAPATTTKQKKKPWEARPAKKLRTKAGKLVDLSAYSDEVVYFAARLVKPTMLLLLDEGGIALTSKTMTLVEKCAYLTAFKSKYPDLDLMQVYQRQKSHRPPKKQKKKKKVEEDKKASSSSSLSSMSEASDDVFANA
ncbi:MAG: hypothetical protein GY738_30325 [Pseudoalteromonas sp.]|nr:hypothetical protein [Pseudoalteromonas sp.]